MAFEKMTADQLWEAFCRTCPVNARGLGHMAVESYQKIGARALKIHYFDDWNLYFLWYDDTNWTLGTKLYRKKPKKLQAKIDALRNELTTLDAQQKAAMDVAKGFANATYPEPSGDVYKKAYEQLLNDFVLRKDQEFDEYGRAIEKDSIY